MLAASVRTPQQPWQRAAACRSAAAVASAAPPAASLRSRNAQQPRALRCASHAAPFTQQRAAALAPRCRRRAAPASRRAAVAPLAALKAITNFDGSFALEPEADAQLRGLLGSATFRTQVASERGWQQPGAETPAVRGLASCAAVRAACGAASACARRPRVRLALTAFSAFCYPQVVFTGRLFTPAPWTPTTKLGMPAVRAAAQPPQQSEPAL
jgi:hypothetical protein